MAGNHNKDTSQLSVSAKTFNVQPQTSTTSATNPVYSGVTGDYNGDGKVTVSDFVGLRRYLSGANIALSSEYRKRADVVPYGVLDVYDLAMLQWIIVNQ